MGEPSRAEPSPSVASQQEVPINGPTETSAGTLEPERICTSPRKPLRFTAGQNLPGRKWLFYNKTLRQLSKWDFLLVLDFDNHFIFICFTLFLLKNAENSIAKFLRLPLLLYFMFLNVSSILQLGIPQRW